jgi:amino acid transporter
VRLGGSVQNVLSLLKLLALGTIVGAGFTHVAGAAPGAGSARFAGPIWPARFGWAELLAMGAAMRYAFFAFSGWEGATYVAEEVREPSRNLPLSIILGISGVTLLFLAANSAYLYQLSPAAIAESKSVAADALRIVTGATGGALVSLAVMLSTFGNVSAQVLVKARTWYAMARDGLFPAPLARVHPRHRTPNVALLAQGVWATVLLAGAARAGHAYESVIDYFSFTSSVFNVSTFAAVWVLRRHAPAAPRPWRVPGDDGDHRAAAVPARNRFHGQRVVVVLPRPAVPTAAARSGKGRDVRSGLSWSDRA